MDERPFEYVRFRENEHALLASFITNDPDSSAPCVFVSGYKSVGKTHVVLQHVRKLGIRQSIINCDEFITQKILLQKCLEAVRVDSGIDLNSYQQKFRFRGQEANRVSLLCETFSQFLSSLEQFVEETGYEEPHVLVLDRFDQCLDHTEGLLRSFMKFREYSSIRNISVIFIFSHEEPREVVSINCPHVRFAPYSIDEIADIIAQDPFAEVLEGKVDLNFWKQFAKLVADLYFEYTGSDVSALKDICQSLWPKFVGLVELESGEKRDFVAIYRDLRHEIIKDDAITNSTVTMYENGLLEENAGVSLSDLPYHSKYILIAAFLASYIDPKLDVQIFSKLKTQKKRVNKKALRSSISKADIDTRLLSASFFELERLRAILSVIYRNESHTLSRDNQNYFSVLQELSERDLAKKETEFNTFTLNKNVDLDTQFATLAGLGLLARTYTKDPLSKKIRWKCNVGWDTIDGIAREISFPLSNYFIEK